MINKIILIIKQQQKKDRMTFSSSSNLTQAQNTLFIADCCLSKNNENWISIAAFGRVYIGISIFI